jgi:hypothetical protein
MADDTMLTGQMASFNRMLGGAWSCTTAVPAMHGMAAHNEQATLTFEVAPNNTLHDHVAGTTYMGDDYFGYSTRMSNYWSSSADNQASHGMATSTDGKTFTGTSSMGMMSMNVVSTYGFTNANSASLHQVMSAGGQQMVFDSTCTR